MTLLYYFHGVGDKKAFHSLSRVFILVVLEKSHFHYPERYFQSVHLIIRLILSFPLQTIDDILPALSSTGFVRSDLVFGNLSKPSESFPLSKSLVGKMLKDSLENLNVGVHLQLHHLVAFDGASQKRELISLTEQPPPGEKYLKNNYQLIIKPYSGTVGNFILQLPVEGGYSGGQLTISNTSGKEQVYDFSNQSDCFFHQLVITSPEPCKVEVEPIQRGTYIALIYNLLWADYFTLSEWYSPRCFGNFVKKAIAIRDCLNNWLPPSAANSIVFF